MSFDLISQFLDDSTIRLFGAGHLGKAIAKGLLAAGLPDGISLSAIVVRRRQIENLLPPDSPI